MELRQRIKRVCLGVSGVFIAAALWSKTHEVGSVSVGEQSKLQEAHEVGSASVSAQSQFQKAKVLIEGYHDPEPDVFARTDGLVKRDGSGKTVRIRFSMNLSNDSHLSSEKWPFVTEKVKIACAPRAMNVVIVKNKYLALNGAMSTDAQRYIIKDQYGWHLVAPFDDTRDLIKEGFALKEASTFEINDWASALNYRLLKECQPPGPPSESWGDWIAPG